MKKLESKYLVILFVGAKSQHFFTDSKVEAKRAIAEYETGYDGLIFSSLKQVRAERLWAVANNRHDKATAICKFLKTID